MPSVSKPGPRLAVVAGTRTVTDAFLTARDIASRVGASQVVAGRPSESASFTGGMRFPVSGRHGKLITMLERLFRLREHGTTARTEVLGGVTTFITMAYILV